MRVMPCCTSMIFPGRTGSSGQIQGSSITSHLPAVASEAMKQHLAGKGVSYRVNEVPNSTRWQIFLRDPHNVEIELNFGDFKNEVGA